MWQHAYIYIIYKCDFFMGVAILKINQCLLMENNNNTNKINTYILK